MAPRAGRPHRPAAGRQWPTPRSIAAPVVVLCLLHVASSANGQQQFNSNSSSSSSSSSSSGSSQPQQSLQSISNWLRLNANQHRDGPAPASIRAGSPTNGVAVEVSPPPSNMLFQYQPAASRKPAPHHQQQAAASSSQTLVATASRNTKLELADQQEGDADQFNLFVSNTCERDFMLIQVRTSRPFYGVIHTLNYRRRPRCSLEGDGGVEYQLNISHALDSRDPSHCGVIKLRKQDAAEPGELLSVVLAIRVHRNVELPDDKFLVLNCTNRCRLSDCSSSSAGARQLAGDQRPIKQRQLEKEFDAEEVATTSQDRTSWWTRAAKRAMARNADQQTGATNTCSIWRFPWLLALVCCLAILLIGSAISNCIICMSLASRSSPVDTKSTKQSKNQTDADERRAGGHRGRTTRDKYINYDNSEYHRPVDVAYLQAAGRTRVAELENRRSSSSNGSHQRPKSSSGKTLRR